MPRSVNPRPQFFDSSGDPLVSGLMYFYEPGTTTPKTTYADVNLSIANSNPVVLSADGRLPNVWFDGSARQVLRDSSGVLIWDIDPVGGANITGPLSEWSPDVTYGMFDIVITSGGKLWRSLIDANTDNAPASSPTAWEQLEFITIWNANVTYALNATVKASDGLFYKSTLNGNVGNDPTTGSVNWVSPVAPPPALGLTDGGTISGAGSVVVNTKYLCDFTSTSYTITLPNAPTAGDMILLTKYGTNAMTLDLNGLKMNGLTNNPVATGEGSTLIRYTGASRGWVEM